jgi:hypothetical protein
MLSNALWQPEGGNAGSASSDDVRSWIQHSLGCERPMTAAKAETSFAGKMMEKRTSDKTNVLIGQNYTSYFSESE